MDPQTPLQPIPSQPSGLPTGGPIATTPDARQKVAEQLKSATNVLVSVSTNPTVDQLAAAIGLTIVLNKLGKHATAVFSGQVPSTMEFLQPEKTLEKNTDSLRDFIIALDKSKADKLRYKVEDKFVKIFITPYHTALSEKDLEFSQGEFNVDVVVALGVKRQEELDQAITAHGRILHDATVISVNRQAGAELGAITLNMTDVSSLCEIMVGLCDLLKTDQAELLDGQIATAFLTGIVAETERFSNAKTMPQTMNAAAKLMNAGANQQLIATKLDEPKPIPKEEQPKAPTSPPKRKLEPNTPAAKPMTPPPPAASPDGALQIPHESKLEGIDKLNDGTYEPSEDEEDEIDKIHIDDKGTLRRLEEMKAEAAEEAERNEEERKLIGTPDPGAKLSANTEPETEDPTTDALSLAQTKPPLLSHDDGASDDTEQTLRDIEKSVNSPHVAGQADVSASSTLKPIQPPAGPSTPTIPSFPPPDPGLPVDPTAANGGSATPPPVPPPFTLPNQPGNDPAGSNSGTVL